MPTSTPNDRPKVDIAHLVDAALEIQCELGPRAAAAFLTTAGARFAMTVRVLAEPGRRRKLDLLPPLR